MNHPRGNPVPARPSRPDRALGNPVPGRPDPALGNPAPGRPHRARGNSVTGHRNRAWDIRIRAVWSPGGGE